MLAIVQGLSEFLPISSSGHLILVPHFLGWPDQGLAFDVAVHVGTLAAVVAYFRRQLLAMSGAWFGSLAGRGVARRHRLQQSLQPRQLDVPQNCPGGVRQQPFVGLRPLTVDEAVQPDPDAHLR